MVVHAIIIHKLSKAVGKQATLKKRDTLLAINEKTLSFVDEISGSYWRSGVHHGIFNADTVSYPFQLLLSHYLEHKHDFVTFSHKALDFLKTKIDTQSLATGSYVIFAHYESDEPYLAILTLDDRHGYGIDDNLNLTEAIHLETDKIHVASTVNLKRWSAGDDRYLSFVQGRRELANYFVSFVGCTDLTSAKEQSRGLIVAVKDYLSAQGTQVDESERLQNLVFDHCSQCIQTKQPIFLASVAAILNGGRPNEFVEFANGEKYKVSSSFGGDRTVLRSLRFVSFRSKTLSISFEKDLFGKSVVYRPKENALVIKNIPPELKEQLPIAVEG